MSIENPNTYMFAHRSYLFNWMSREIHFDWINFNIWQIREFPQVEYSCRKIHFGLTTESLAVDSWVEKIFSCTDERTFEHAWYHTEDKNVCEDNRVWHIYKLNKKLHNHKFSTVIRWWSCNFCFLCFFSSDPTKLIMVSEGLLKWVRGSELLDYLVTKKHQYSIDL